MGSQPDHFCDVAGETEDARRRLTALEDDLRALAVRTAAPASPASPEPYAAGARRPASAPAPPLAGSQLVAVEMAVTGASRAEVRRQLHDGYGVEDPGTILDEVFGPGTPDDTRVAWNL